jgi:hypothetical protein
MDYGKIGQSVLRDGYVQLHQIASPTGPATGETLLYSKTGGKLYSVINGGVETEVGSGTGPTGPTGAGSTGATGPTGAGSTGATGPTGTSGGGSGYKTIYIPASQMTPRSDSGATPGSYESSTYKVHFETLDFDPDVAQYAQFNLIMPEDWDLGTIKAKFLWTADTGSGVVYWALQAQSLSDDEAIDAAWGTVQVINDTLLSLLDNHLSPATPAITVSPTPVSGDNICFQVYRDATNGSDNFSGNARLISVFIQYNATLTPTAW